MKHTAKLLSLPILLVALVSCEAIHNVQAIYEYFDDAYADQDIPYQPCSLDEAWQWVSVNIEYRADPQGGRKRSPEETYALRYGDCEDYALLLAYFGYTLGLDVRVVVSADHAICKHNGLYIEPQVYNKYYDEFPVTREYTYQEAFYTPFIRSTNN